MLEPEKECRPKCRSSQHAYQLNTAVSKGNLRQVQLFFATCHNADSAFDEHGRTVLHIAASFGRHDIVQWLISDKSVDLSAKDLESAWTSLHRSLFYGQLTVARLLVANGGDLFARDRDGLSVLDLVKHDRLKHFSLKRTDPQEVFSWGGNHNFTLGHETHQAKKHPERIDFFHKNNISVKQVVLCKYHSVYLSTQGKVYSCGIGTGGRLGLGHERTCLVPDQITGLEGEVCTSISASRDHTVILTESGNIYSCGLNKHHVLGHYPAPELSLVPKIMNMKSMKGIKWTGALASKYHTVLFTSDAIYTFGLNAGQLGHQKVHGEVFVSQPRQVSAFIHKDFGVKNISTADGATVVYTTRGDVYVLHEYQCRKIASKLLDVVQLSAVGGHLDSEALNVEQTRELVKQELTVALLLSSSQVYLWRSNTLMRCCWSACPPVNIVQVSLCHGSLVFLSTDGECFTAQLAADLKHQTQTDFSATARYDSQLTLPVQRVATVHRATSVAVDSKCTNFLALQSIPTACMTEIPQCRESDISAKFIDLLNDSNLADTIHDCIIKVNNKQIPAHKYVLSYRSDYFRKVFCEKSMEDMDFMNGKVIVNLDNIDYELFISILKFIYTDACDVLTVGYTAEKEQLKLDTLSENVTIVTDFPKNASAFAVAQESKKKKKKNLNKKSQQIQTAEGNPLKALEDLARKFGIKSLLNRIQSFKIKDGQVILAPGRHSLLPHVRWDRNKFRNLCDVDIKCEDGRIVRCHKCVLVARMEYFHSMLCSDWIEATSTEALQLPIPSDILEIVLHYVYSDELVADITDAELVCNVLVVADQLLLPRLKDLCEIHLASLIDMRNACELLELASVYCANQLKVSCQQFIVINLAALLETRALDILSDEVMDELSQYYKLTVPGVDKRKMTPWEGWPDNDYLEKLETQFKCEENGTYSGRSSTEGAKKTKHRKKKPRRKSTSEDIKSVEHEEPHNIPDSPDLPETPNTTRQTLVHGPTEMTKVATKTEVKPVSATTPSVASNKEKAGVSVLKTGAVAHGLKDIMAEEMANLQLDSKSSKHSSGAGKRPVKLSQRERKRQTSQRLSESDQADLATSPTSPCPWGQVSPVVHSFKQLVLSEENSQPVSPQPLVAKKVVPTSPKSPPPSNATWADVSSSVTKDKTVSKSISFAEILEAEKQQKDSLQRATNKPLAFIQIEEQAIQELLSAYGAAQNWDELITVERVPQVQASPTWHANQQHH